LRILIQNRPDSRTSPGGDTVQMDRTADYLRSIGHQIEISFDASPDLSNIDLVHLFNLTTPDLTVAQARNALKQGKPYVLSSIYWDLDAAVPWTAYEFPRNWAKRLLPRRAARKRALQLEILRGARLIFPNSIAERDHILEGFKGLDATRFVVTLNGVDKPGMTNKGTGKYFLCAGAIGPRKNQLNLVRAFWLLRDHRLLIVGEPAAGCRRYAGLVRQKAKDNVEFRHRVDHDEMPRLIAECRALVQPSYIETPGLSAMEAAAIGVPIIVSNVAPVREYFGDLAYYCDPSRPASIAKACQDAANAGPLNGSEFAKRFAWLRVLPPLETALSNLM
jgi:glycosyltransferase involved in cell wall biosynthesis